MTLGTRGHEASVSSGVMKPVLLSVAVLGIVAGSCAGPSQGPVDVPTGADEVVLRVEVGRVGLMHPMEVMNPDWPTLTLYGDGLLLIEEARERRGFLTTYTASRLSQVGIRMVVDQALEVGLQGEDRELHASSGTDGDGTTYVTVMAAGKRHLTSAWNLEGTGESEDDLDGEVVRGREALRGFLAKLADPGWLGDEILSGPEPFDPGRWAAVWAVARDSANEGPWSLELLGEFDVRPWPLGGLAKLGEPLPGSGTIRCALIKGQDLRELWQQLDDGRMWESEGVTYYLYARPLLPDEASCQALHP